MGFSGTAQGGHYWAIQRQLPERADRWLKYNDSQVSEVDALREVFRGCQSDSTLNEDWGGSHQRRPCTPAHQQDLPPPPHSAHQTPLHHPSSPENPLAHDLTANPYWLTYVRTSDIHRFQMLLRNPLPPPTSTLQPPAPPSDLALLLPPSSSSLSH